MNEELDLLNPHILQDAYKAKLSIATLTLCSAKAILYDNFSSGLMQLVALKAYKIE